MTPREINQKIARLLQKGDKSFDDLMDGFENNLLKAYREALRGIKSDIASMYEKYGDTVTYKDMVSYQRLSNLETRIKENIKELTKGNQNTIKGALTTFAEETYSSTGEAYSQALGTNLAFGVMDKKVVEAMIINPLDRITWSERLAAHSEVYSIQIKQELARGLIQGEGYAKIAAKITEKTKLSAEKTIRIVRTEGHRVQSTARLVATDNVAGAAERLGYTMVRVWVAAKDDRTRSSHAEMDGKEADDDGQFTLPDGVRCDAPGLTGVAEHDINCRCTVITEIKGG